MVKVLSGQPESRGEFVNTAGEAGSGREVATVSGRVSGPRIFGYAEERSLGIGWPGVENWVDHGARRDPEGLLGVDVDGPFWQQLARRLGLTDAANWFKVCAVKKGLEALSGAVKVRAESPGVETGPDESWRDCIRAGGFYCRRRREIRIWSRVDVGPVESLIFTTFNYNLGEKAAVLLSQETVLGGGEGGGKRARATTHPTKHGQNTENNTNEGRTTCNRSAPTVSVFMYNLGVPDTQC